MHWESYYVKPENVSESELLLVGEEVHHLVRVVRKQKGDLIWAVDGLGAAYQVSVVSISNSEVWGRIIKTRRRIGEPVAEVILAQGILKGDRFDFLVEKATEIGVRKIMPFISKNSVATAGSQKIIRWRRVALAAMKQSGRSWLPEITEPVSLDRVLVMGSNCHKRYIAHPVTGSSPTPFPPDRKSSRTAQKVMIAVGPAGGFSDNEIEEALDQGFKTVGLGPRRLRSETAGIVLCTLVLSQLGELE
jgi:16S rRNA (uracil1498-N3)-methyltransferase